MHGHIGFIVNTSGGNAVPMRWKMPFCRGRAVSTAIAACILLAKRGACSAHCTSGRDVCCHVVQRGNLCSACESRGACLFEIKSTFLQLK